MTVVYDKQKFLHSIYRTPHFEKRGWQKSHFIANWQRILYYFLEGSLEEYKIRKIPPGGWVSYIIYNKHRETYIIYRRRHKKRAILFWATKHKYYFLLLSILPKSSINVNIPHFPRKNIIFYLSFILLFTNFLLTSPSQIEFKP